MNALYVWFIEPWTLGAWMWRACAAAALAAVPCAVLGVFLVLRRQSMIADALTHVALPGIVAAFLLTGSLSPLPMLLGATSAGVLATALMDRLGRSPHVRADAAIGIVFTAMFAAGVVALTMFVRHAHLDTRCALFGDVLGISDESLRLLSIVCPLVLMGVVAGWRWLSLVSFDEGFARHVGAPVVAVHYALMVATSMTAVASFEAIGAILALAMFITPASTARLLTDRLTTMVAVAVGHGLLSALWGMYASVWFEVSSSGAIVTCSGLLYAAAFVFAPRHGALARWRTRAASRPRTPRAIACAALKARVIWPRGVFGLGGVGLITEWSLGLRRVMMCTQAPARDLDPHRPHHVQGLDRMSDPEATPASALTPPSPAFLDQALDAMRRGMTWQLPGSRAHTTYGYDAALGQWWVEHFEEGYVERHAVSEASMRESVASRPQLVRAALYALERQVGHQAMRRGDAQAVLDNLDAAELILPLSEDDRLLRAILQAERTPLDQATRSRLRERAQEHTLWHLIMNASGWDRSPEGGRRAMALAEAIVTLLGPPAPGHLDRLRANLWALIGDARAELDALTLALVAQGDDPHTPRDAFDQRRLDRLRATLAASTPNAQGGAGSTQA